MEKFNKKKFDQLQKDSNESYQLESGVEVKMSEAQDIYQESRKEVNSFYSTTKTYFKESRNVKLLGNYFQRIPVGVHQEYDEAGKLIEEIDYDKEYAFSLEDVQKKLLEEFELDIFDTEQAITVSRNANPTPCYKIFILQGLSLHPDKRVILIDGVSGKIVSDQVYKSEK